MRSFMIKFLLTFRPMAEEYEKAKNQALNYIAKGFHLGGEITVSREELRER
jgi:hypothetical protein